jgi:GNAT superfamily N-acetyltransferase
MEVIKYWVLECAKEFDINKQTVMAQFMALYAQGLLKIQELPERKGLVAWVVSPDMMGGIAVCEMFLYIKPEHRGNPRNLLRLIKVLEDEAKLLGCSVQIASSFDFRDNKLLKLLQRKGYKVGSVRKEF